MGVKINVREYDLAKMVDMYNDGMSYLKISKETGYPYKTTVRELKEAGYCKRDNSFYRKEFQCNTKYFNNINTEDKAYWLGFIWADGYLGKNTSKTCPYKLGISISLDDIGHLEKFKRDISSNHTLSVYDVQLGYKVGAMYCRININENEIVNSLIRHGVRKQKSKSQGFVNLDNFEDNISKHIVRGYIDGNGSYRESNGYYKLDINGNKESLLEIERFCNKYNVVFKWGERHPERDNNNYTIYISDINGIKKITDLILCDAKTFLDRKHKKMIEFTKKYDLEWRCKYE